MTAWRRVEKPSVLGIHAEQIAHYGGARGVRDDGGLESAISRPQNLAAYEEPDGFRLAAAYAFGIARNHPFVDGNKRTAFVVAATFLAKNGLTLQASEAEVVLTFLRLAAGDMTEDELARWFRANAALPADAFLVPEQDQ